MCFHPEVPERYAIVSCHVERLLDDRVWSAFSRLQARRPGGFEIASVIRPPDPAAGEDEDLWIARARIVAARGPFGLHTHWGGASQARPLDGSPAERVRVEAAWLEERGFRPRLFCGGGWYMDEQVGRAVAELGYTDCTATAFSPAYLEPGAPRLSLASPALVRVDGVSFLEAPATHSLGMAARAALGPLPPYVHVYFHDTDLVHAGRRRALELALAVVGRRCRRTTIARLETHVEVDFGTIAGVE